MKLIPIILFYLLIMNTSQFEGTEITIPKDKNFICSHGDKLVVGENNKEIFLRGFCYSGFSYFSPGVPNKVEESVYSDLVQMNMNTVRLSLSYNLFYESNAPWEYKPSIWEWINSHVLLAKKYNVYLILQLTQVEGAQFTPIPNMPFDYRIWEKENIQDNFISLWVEIAKRYNQEDHIAGYSIFCEPVCSETIEQWMGLANKTIEKIREVDKNHIIFVERAYGEYETRRELTDMEIPAMDAYFKIDDNNVVYEFYFFETDDYTHQYASWRPELQKSTMYPDSNTIITYHEKNGRKKEFRFDKEYLEFYLKKQIAFGKSEKVPMSVWGFGLTKNCYQDQNGGLLWMNDVIELFNRYHLNWTIFYNSPSFGISDNVEVKRLIQENLK